MTKKEFERLLEDFRQAVYEYGADEGEMSAEEYSFFTGDRTRADALEKQILDAFAEMQEKFDKLTDESMGSF